MLKGPRSVELVDLEEPELRDGSVIVEIDACGIGGTDLESFVTGHVPAPAWFGHEWSGRVVDVGGIGDRPEIRDRFVGERVVGSAPPACGQCRTCRAGFADQCSVVIETIVGADPLADRVGGFSERIRVDARRIARVPEGIDQLDAALAEPASVAAHAVARSNVGLGDLVVVIGAGTIGLLVCELARLAGATRIVAIDPEPTRQELACDLGSDAAFSTSLTDGPEATQAAVDWLARTGHGLGADVVFDCVGTGHSMKTGVELVRRGGTVVAVGVTPDERHEATGDGITPAMLINRQITLKASQGYLVNDVRRVLGLMAEDRLRVAPIYDPEPFPLAAVGDLLEELVVSPVGRLKPLIQPRPLGTTSPTRQHRSS